MTFGERLKKLRRESNMTQEELAKKCGLKKQSISRYENSEREPNIRIAKTLAEALDAKLEELVPVDVSLDLNFFNKEPSEAEQKLIETHKQLLKMFDSLDPASQQFVLAQLRGAVLAQQEQDKESESE